MYTPFMADVAPVAELPALNLLARPLLLALCRRALSPAADPALAPLTARRIEHARMAQTELLKRISALKADVGITQEKALASQRTAQQADLDLRLFTESNPPAPQRRGLFKPQYSNEQQEIEQQRKTQSAIADQTARVASIAQARAEAASRELLQLESELAASRRERSGHELVLRDEVGAWVLELVAAGRAEEARRALADLRRNLRGEVVIGALCVLVELFDSGSLAARQALAETASIFEQHRDPAVRVLEALITLGSAGLSANPVQFAPLLSRSDTGAYLREQFAEPGLYRLYTLSRVLGGLGFDATAVEHDPLRSTYEAITAYAAAGQVVVQADNAATTITASSEDAFTRLLLANTLLRAGLPGDVLALCSFDLAAWRPPQRKREALPSLYACTSAIALPAWPQAFMAQVYAALACHGLLAAQAIAPPQLMQAWLTESYGWPKSDFYWWALAKLQDDPSLLRNITREPDQLLPVA
jgi:hypothetical protein